MQKVFNVQSSMSQSFKGITPYESTTGCPQYHNCPYCGCMHSGTCPKIKSIEYHPDGTIKKVEFHGREGYPCRPIWINPWE